MCGLGDVLRTSDPKPRSIGLLRSRTAMRPSPTVAVCRGTLRPGIRSSSATTPKTPLRSSISSRPIPTSSSRGPSVWRGRLGHHRFGECGLHQADHQTQILARLHCDAGRDRRVHMGQKVRRLRFTRAFAPTPYRMVFSRFNCPRSQERTQTCRNASSSTCPMTTSPVTRDTLRLNATRASARVDRECIQCQDPAA